MDKEGVVILGAPRSGTTLIRRILDAHPSIACPGTTYLLGAASRFLHSETLGEDLDFGVLAGLGFAGFGEDEVIDRLREFTFSFNREHAARSEKPRWGEKTTLEALELPLIERICGDHVHYVVLVRHGLDVVTSLDDMCRANRGYLSQIHEYVIRYPCWHEAFAHLWVDITERLLELASRHDAAVLVRYEDLVAEPEHTLSTLFEHLGETYPDGLIEAALSERRNIGLGDWKTYQRNGISPDSVGRRQSLSPTMTSRLGEIVNPTLTAAGYDPIKVTPRLTPEQARHRYRIGLMAGALRAGNKD